MLHRILAFFLSIIVLLSASSCTQGEAGGSGSSPLSPPDSIVPSTQGTSEGTEPAPTLYVPPSDMPYNPKGDTDDHPIDGYDADALEYLPRYRHLYCASPRFLGYFFTKSVTEGGADWYKEDGVLRVGFTRRGKHPSGTVDGAHVSFYVRLEDGAILSKEFTPSPSKDDEPIELSNEAMRDVAYRLFVIIANFEASQG